MALSTNSNNFLAQKAVGSQQRTDRGAFKTSPQRSKQQQQQQQQTNERNTGQVEESEAIIQQKQMSMSIKLSMVSPQQLCDLQRRNARSQQLLDHQTMECDSFHTDRLDAQRQMADLASRLQIAEDTLRQERDLRADLDTKARLAQQNLEEEWINEIEETKTLNRQLRVDLEESSKVVSARSVETVRQEQKLSQLRSQSEEEKSQLIIQLANEKTELMSQFEEDKSQLIIQLEKEKQLKHQFEEEKSQLVIQLEKEKQLKHQLEEDKSQLVIQLEKEKQLKHQLEKEKIQVVARHEEESRQLELQLDERNQLHASDQKSAQELLSKLCETETLNTKMTGSIEDLTSKQNKLITDLETRKKHIRRAEDDIAVKDGLIERNSAELTELRREMNLKQADFDCLRNQVYRQRSKLFEEKKALSRACSSRLSVETSLATTKRQLQQAVDVVKKSFQAGMILRKDLATTHSQLRNETDATKTLRDEVTRISKLSERLSTELQTAASTIQGMQAIATATATDTEGLRCGLADAELKIQRLVIDLSSSKTMSEETNKKLVEVEAGLTDAETKLTDAETKLTEANATIVMKNQKINSTETTARDALAQNERLQNSLSSLQLADERHRIQLATAEGKAGSCKSDFDQSEAARSALLRFIFMVLGLEESGVEDTLAETRDSEHGLVETTQTQIARFLSAWEIETLSVAGLEQHLSAASETILVLRNKLESLLLKYRLDMQAWSDKMERRVNSDKVRFDTALSTARSAKSKYERDVDILETRIETLVEELSTVSEEFSIIEDYFETNKGFVLQ